MEPIMQFEYFSEKKMKLFFFAMIFLVAFFYKIKKVENGSFLISTA